MCPHTNGDVLPAEESEMVQIPLTNGTSNGVHTNGKRGSSRSNAPRNDGPRRNPYAPRASDFLSNISNFNIIESTLRGLSFSISILAHLNVEKFHQRESNSPMHSSTPRPRLPLLKPWTLSVLNTSSLHLPLLQSNHVWTARQSAS